MIHNDVLRRLRFALAINDTAAIGIFKMVEYDMDIEYLHAIMKKEDEEGYLPCRDKIIALFLDGLIIKNRGKQEGQMPRVLEAGERLSNNEILRKLRIAMSYKDEDMIDVLKLANFRMSKGELSAFFRKPDHRNFKPAGDQVVRNLLQGMVKKYRPDSTKQKANISSRGAAQKTHARPKVTQSQKADQQPKSKPTTTSKSSETQSVWGKINKG